MSKLLTERKCSCVQWAWKMKALLWCWSSTEAFTLTCGLTRWPVSREQGEYKKTVPTKAYFLKENLPRCCSHLFFILSAKKICKKLGKWSGKPVNFPFWMQKNCINIYSAYLCIFFFIYLGAPRAKPAGVGELCMSHSQPPLLQWTMESNGSRAKNFASDFSTFLARWEPCTAWLLSSASPGIDSTLHVKYFIPRKNWKCIGTATASAHEQLEC